MNAQPVIVERTFAATPAQVWHALTDSEAFKHWYFDIKNFRAEVGFTFSFAGTGKDGKGYFVHLCEITEAVPERKLAYTWRYEGYEGNSLVTITLTPEGEGKTVVKLTHTGLETFPAQEDFARANFEEGWNYIIGTSLADYLSRI